MNEFQKIEQEVLSFLHLAKTDAAKALSAANVFVNKVLAFEQTPEGQEILLLVDAVVPAPVQSAVKLALPVFFKAMKWATDEVAESDDDILKEGVTYLLSLTGVTKALQANSIAAWLSNFIDPANLTIQQSLLAAQPVHNPALVTA